MLGLQIQNSIDKCIYNKICAYYVHKNPQYGASFNVFQHHLISEGIIVLLTSLHLSDGFS